MISRRLKVRHFPQGVSYCGPASLRSLLSYFKKTVSEKRLVRLAGSSREKGTSHEGMVRALKALGGSVFVKSGGTIGEIRYFTAEKRLPVVVNWFDKNEGHYSVVVAVTAKNVIMVDPAAQRPERRLKRDFFQRVWFDFVGPAYTKAVWRWYVVVSFKKRH